MPKKIVFPAGEDLWDESTSSFIPVKEQTLVLEHSLISLSKWEQKWKKPFLSVEEKSVEEWMDYFRCMTLNQVNDNIYDRITQDVFQEILDYIGDPMTATTFTDLNPGAAKREIITSEIIYYNMFSFGIPKELDKWHLNTLIALIRVFSIKNGGSKKMSQSEAAAYQRAINESRIAGRKTRR